MRQRLLRGWPHRWPGKWDLVWSNLGYQGKVEEFVLCIGGQRHSVEVLPGWQKGVGVALPIAEARVLAFHPVAKLGDDRLYQLVLRTKILGYRAQEELIPVRLLDPQRLVIPQPTDEPTGLRATVLARDFPHTQKGRIPSTCVLRTPLHPSMGK